MTPDDELHMPDPPTELRATQEDVSSLESLVQRVGWHETLWRIGQLLVKHCRAASGTRKGALRAAANHVNFIVPGLHWCNHSLDLKWPTAEAPQGEQAE
jgi:hypothetical protein